MEKNAANNQSIGEKLTCAKNEKGFSLTNNFKNNRSVLDKEGVILPPDGGYGWVVVLASFTNSFIIGGNFVCFPMIYYDVAEYFGVSLAYAGFIQSFLQGFISVPGILYSVVINTYGCRQATIFGSILSCIGYSLSSLAFNIPWIYFTYGVITGVGLGIQLISNAVIVNQYFDKRRSIANAVALSGTSLGILVMSFAIQILAEKYSWQGTLLICGGVSLHACVGGAIYRPLQTSKHKRTENNTADKNRGDVASSRINHTSNACSGDGIQAKRKQETTRKLENNDTDLPENVSTHVLPGSPRYTKRRFSQQAVIQQGYVEDNLKRKVNVYVVSETSGLAKLKVSLSVEEQQSAWRRTWIMIKQGLDFSKLKDSAFLLFLIASMLYASSIVTFHSHNINRAIVYGVAKERLAILPTVGALCSGTARITSGIVGNFYSINPILLVGVGEMVGGISLVWNSFLTTYMELLIGTAVFAMSAGFTMTSLNLALIRLQGIERIAQSIGLFNLFFGTGSIISTPLAGLIYDVTGDYSIPFLIGGFAAMTAASFVFLSFVLTKRKEMGRLEIQ